MITLDDSFAHRAKMPCGHVISTDSMVYLMRDIAKSHKDYKVCCPAIKKGTLNQKCNTEWPYALCKKVAIFSKSERAEIEEGFAKNFELTQMKAEICPTCNAALVREGELLNQLKAHCPNCLKKNPSKAFFCWCCKRNWNNPGSTQSCGNLKCSRLDTDNMILQQCKDKTIDNIIAPERRACPFCFTLIEHIA